MWQAGTHAARQAGRQSGQAAGHAAGGCGVWGSHVAAQLYQGPLESQDVHEVGLVIWLVQLVQGHLEAVHLRGARRGTPSARGSGWRQTQKSVP